jgi:hypothetical protein
MATNSNKFNDNWNKLTLFQKISVFCALMLMIFIYLCAITIVFIKLFMVAGYWFVAILVFAFVLIAIHGLPHLYDLF